MSFFQRRSARLIVLSYAVALSAIAGATLTIHFQNAAAVERQDQLGTLINVSGRQRMLSQRLPYLRALATGALPRERTEGAAAAYAEAAAAFASAHDRLTRGELRWRETHPRAGELDALYAGGLDAEVRAYAAQEAAYAQALLGGASAPLPVRPADLLARLDAATNLHEAASQQIVDEARSFTREALFVVLVLLLVEAALVAAPTALRLAKVEDELTALAGTDPLTGVRNRRALMEAAEGHLRLAVRARRSLGVIVLDIDHFKRVNDTHGHGVGDEAIRHVVGVAGATLRASDLLGRVGGEEFVIVCPDTDAAGAWEAAEKVRAAVEAAPLPLPAGPLRLTISLGVHAERPVAGRTLDALVEAADARLYEAKRGGRNRVVGTRAAPRPALVA